MSDFKPFERGTKTQDYEGAKKAMNPNRHIHLGIKIPKYFEHTKYFLKP